MKLHQTSVYIDREKIAVNRWIVYTSAPHLDYWDHSPTLTYCEMVKYCQAHRARLMADFPRYNSNPTIHYATYPEGAERRWYDRDVRGLS